MKGMVIIMKKLCAVLISAIMFSALVCPIEVQAETLSLSAKSAILIEAETGRVVYEKNGYEQMPMASTTKIMSTLLTIEHGDLETYFTVDSEAIKVEGSSMGLQEGDMVRLVDLCYGMMLPSGNDAANAAAVRVSGSVDSFVALMNARAKEIGMQNTNFVTPSGLDDYTDNHYSTAYDMALLTREALKNVFFRELCSTKYGKTEFGNPPFERWLTNSNKLLNTCEGVFGVKTGFTDKARRCLVSACERDGVTLVCITLNASDDWNDHSKMYDYGFSQVKSAVLPVEHTGFRFAVVGGSSKTVDATIMNLPTASLFSDELESVEAVYHVSRFLYAPIEVGDVLAYCDYYLDGELIFRSEYCATGSVSRIFAEPEEKGFFKKIADKIRGVFK